MKTKKVLQFHLSAAMLSCALLASAQAPMHWVGTWACAVVGEKVAAAKGVPVGPNFQDSTIRDVVHVTLGGASIRLRVSNEFGDKPLRVSAVHVALSAGLDATVPGSDRAVTFGDKASFTIPAGKAMLSDPVVMEVKPFSSLAVSLFVPKQDTNLTYHATALSTNFVAKGDATTATSLPQAMKLKSWVLLSGVDVAAPANARAVVTLGDSITDGMISTVDGNKRWPDDLARRLAADPRTANVSVLNAGISGGRILWPQAGPSMVDRFDRDVLGQAGVKYVILFAGINDINHSQNRPDPQQPESADDLIAGMKKIIAMGHAHGLKVYGATITPEGGSKFAKPGGEAARQAINAWIRSGQGFDAFFDFDKVVSDPAHTNPETLLPQYGGEKSGFIHLYDSGYQALADSIDLSKFQ